MKKEDLLKNLFDSPLITDRTVLRPMDDEDIVEFLKHTVCSFALGGTELEELFKEKCKEQLSSNSEITFSIRLSDTGLYIGYFELKGLDGEPEIGIDLIENYQNQGFGYEVCQTVIDYIFARTDIDVLKYNCFRNNIASLQLAKKLGAVQVTEKVLFEKLQEAGLSQSTINESIGFDLIVHEIRKKVK